jgi:prepilin-type N-terminal cleavage/methylation domain-containing protein
MIELLCSERNAIFLPSYMVSLKTQATASNQGFTLVELIVVITILAILGTIGFISLQGYSAQSRDTKRTSDLRTLVSTMSVKSTEGLALSALVSANGNQLLTPASTSVAGAASSAADLFAGIPNYTVLGIDANGFKDGVNDYKVGVTTKGGGQFQIAATAEKLDPVGKTALVTGSYVPRTVVGTTSTSLAVTAVDVTNDTITLATGDIGKYKAGDTLGILAGL